MFSMFAATAHCENLQQLLAPFPNERLRSLLHIACKTTHTNNFEAVRRFQHIGLLVRTFLQYVILLKSKFFLSKRVAQVRKN